MHPIALIAVFVAAGDFSPRVEKVERLTSSKGCEEFPSFSPDGSSIVFDSFIDSGYGIFVLDLASKNTRRLTMQKQDYWQYWDDWDYAPTLSADGRLVAYLHDTADGTELRTLPIEGDGSEPPTVVAVVRDNEPVWVADRSLVALDRNDDVARFDLGPPVKTRVLGHLPKAYVGYGFIAFADGGVLSRVLLASSPLLDWSLLAPKNGHFSPIPLDRGPLAALRFKGGVASADGSAFYQTLGNQLDESHLVWRQRQGGQAHVIAGAERATMGIAIAHDRKHLAFSDCNAYYQIVRFNAAGEMTELVPRSTDAMRTLPRSFGSHSVLFTRTNGKEVGLSLLDLATLQVSPFLDAATDAVVSHDQQRVALVDQEKGGIAVQAPGLGLARITLSQMAGDHRPEWTRNDANIVFLRGSVERKGGAQLFMVSANGKGQARPLGPAHIGAFALSPTADRIAYYALDKEQLFEMDLSGGQSRLLLGNAPKVTYQDLRYASDGRTLLAVAEQKRLLRIDLTTEKQTLIVSSGYAGVESADFAPDGDGFIAGVRIWDGDLWLATGDFP